MAITHKYTLICDDIRQENTGKFILIGLYTDTITIPHVPFQLPSLSFFQVFETTNIGNKTFRMRLERAETGQVIVEGGGLMQIQKPGIGVTPVRFAPLPIPAFGLYNFVVTIEGHEDPIVTTFNIVHPPVQPMR